MRWNRLLLLVLAVVLLVVGAGLAFLSTLDLNDYKQNIERFVVRQTGRAFAIEGRIDFDLGRYTSLTVNDVHLGNPDWATDEDMARVQRASVVLDVYSLWSGPVIIELLELDNAELNLEQRESGENNWTFGDGSEESGGGLMPLILSQVHVANFSLTVATPALDQPLEIRINRLDQVQKEDGLFDAKLRGTLNGRSVNIAGEYGPLESLLNATDLNIDIAGQFDTLSITVDGLIDDLVRPRQPRVDIEITGPDIDHVTGMLGLPDLGGGDLDLKISLKPGKQDVAASVVGRIGEHQIELTGSVSDFIAFEQITMRVSAHGPNLNDAASLFGVPQFPSGPYQLSGSVTRDGPQLDLDDIYLEIGEAQLHLDGLLKQFPDLTDANLALDIRGQNLGRFTRLFGLPGKAQGPFKITGQLEVAPDGVEIARLDVDTQIVQVNGSGTISSEPKLVGTRVSLSARGTNISDITELLGIPLATSDPFTFTGDLEIGEDAVILSNDSTFTMGGHQLVASGRIGFDSENDADLRLRIGGDDLAELAQAFGINESVPSLRYETSAHLQVMPKGYQISGLQARIGDAEFSIDGLVSRREKFIGTRLKIGANGPDLSQFIADSATWNVPDGTFGMSGEFELLADAIRLRGLDVKLGGATGRIDADIGLPIASANGTFDMTANGGSLRTVLPDTGPWEPPDSPFEIRAQGKLEDGLVYLEPIRIQLGDASVTAEGVFDLPPDPSRTSLKISARVASLTTIGAFDKFRLPDSKFSLDAKFSGTPQSYSIEDLEILTGTTDLTGNITVHLDREIPDVNLQLQSNRFDLTPLLIVNSELDEEIEATGDETGDGSGEKPVKDSKLIPDWPLPLEQLAKFNAVVDIDITLREIDNLMFDATLRDGRLDVERASGKTAYGSISTTLRIVPTDDSATVHTTFEGENLFLGTSKGRTREEIDGDPKFKISITLDGTGLTLRDIAANLNGQIKMSADEGRTPNTALRFIYGNFFEELFAALDPFAKADPYTEISCVMIVADIENGLINAKPGMAVQTGTMNVISEGTIDLRTEKLDINFKTQPRKKISISAGEFINPYLKVSGTLANPRLMLDPTGTLVTGGAAVATFGLSILATALWDRVSSSSDPCSEIVKQAEKKQEKKK